MAFHLPIFAGPVGNPSDSVILIKGGIFSLASFDFSSNNGDSGYFIEGFFGGISAFSSSGTLPGEFSPFMFSTLVNPDSAILVDTLQILLFPRGGTSSINLDNTVLNNGGNPVPDVGSTLALLGLGLGALGGLRARMRS